jgi:hypothetical protein
MKDVRWLCLHVQSANFGWGSICGGVTANTVRPVSLRTQGVAARHFERGTNYD